MDDLIQWLRQQIHWTRTTAEDAAREWPTGPDGDEIASEVSSIEVGAHIVLNDPRAVLAQCEAHAAILEIVERYGPPQRIPATDFTTTLSGLAPYYALQRVLAAVAHAYQHRPGYEEATTFLRQPTSGLVGRPIDDWPAIGRHVEGTEWRA